MFKQLYWHTPDRILVSRIEEMISIQDLAQTTQAIERLFEQSPPQQPFYLIYDVTERSDFDVSLFNYRDLRRWTRPHPLLGWMVVVDRYPSLYVRYLVQQVCRAFGIRLHVVTTLDAALAFLHQVDPALPILPAAPPLAEPVDIPW